MALERISFDNRAPPYDAQLAAQHLARYLLVREQVKGMRVLDVACGQGFGSHLMAQWGAAQVVGVDIAREAIEAARSIFPHKSVQYVVGDAINLDQVLGNEPPFDVIVCLETIEHVSQPVRLLEHLATFRGLHSTLVISCPNDHVEDGRNPYHQRRFTFEEFRDLATEKLGAASQWLLGVPLLGQLNYVLGDASVEETGSEAINAIRLQQLSSAFVAPANETTKPDRTNCTYYVGVWGTALKPNAVIAPQSQTAFVAPWRTIKWLQEQQPHNEAYQALRRRLLFHTEARNQLNAELAEWRRFHRQSRGYRALSKYYGLYRVPIISHLLIAAHRIVHHGLAFVRRTWGALNASIRPVEAMGVIV